MNQCQITFICLGLLFNVSILHAQQLPPVRFDFGDVEFERNLTDQESLEDVLKSDLFDDLVYVWAQFDKIPNAIIKADLISKGVRFIEYIPTQCYLLELPREVRVPLLMEAGARSIQPMMQPSKIDIRVVDHDIPMHALTSDGQIKMQLVTMPDVHIKNKIAQLQDLGAHHLQTTRHERHLFLSTHRESALAIAQLPWVRYLEIVAPPGEAESVEGMAIQRANLLNNALTGGLRLDGTGVKILVRDDGDVGPHIDFQGRLWNDPANTRNGTHGDGVAGVWAAAGNLDPTVVAGGSGADIYTVDYEPSFLDRTLSLHQDSGILITNSSYSNGCNDGYTLSTMTVDEQVFENPSLLHVFSAGNSNGSDCDYGAGGQWGNITGGHKQGKNVIATANLDRLGDLEQSSSRGPAHDGRIKPDLAAHGAGQISTGPNNRYRSFGGTSAAAPTVASSIAQLYQAYAELNGSMPPSALIKACAMNSAQDLGNPGPDFSYGWGSMHAGRAYEILAENQYWVDIMDHGDSHMTTIDVPDGVGQLRVMLYWSDPPASLNAATALVNDLDLTVRDPASNILFPYLLDHSPNVSTLDDAAGRGADHLNNVEQVAVFNPVAGTYTINISGQAIAQGPQEYYIVYSFIPQGVHLTYPVGNEKLIQNTPERIHWDAFGNTDPFSLEYSIDGGSSWIVINDNISAHVRAWDWTPPTVVSGDCLLRISRGAELDVSDETFSIHSVPTNIHFLATAADSAIISWSPVNGAQSYTIYQLGEKYMEVIGQRVDTFFAIGNLEDQTSYWLTVSANTMPAEGQRALARQYYHARYAQCSGCLDFHALPYLEDFEHDDFGYHCNYAQDSIDWVTLEGATASNQTGPERASVGYRYAYVEASNPNNPSKVADLGGPCLDLSTCTNAYIQFDYHMFGENLGELKLVVSTDDGVSWSPPIWAKEGDQGQEWHTEVIDLSGYCGGRFLYRFIGTTGDGFRSDIAIDHIYIDEGVVCDIPDNLRTDSIGDTDAFISWDASLNGSPYDLEIVNIDANMLFTGVPTITDHPDLTYHLTGLTSLNTYEVYMRAQCDIDSSTWIGPLTFVPGCNLIPGNSFELPLEVTSFPYADTNSLDQVCSQSFWGNDGRELVYKIQTADDTDRLNISTCNGVTNFDTYIFLLDSARNLVELNDDAEEVCEDLGYFDVLSILNVNVQPRTTYYVVMAGFDEFEFGEYAIHINSMTCDSAMYTTTVDTSVVAGTTFLGNVLFADTTIVLAYPDSNMGCDSVVIYYVEVYSAVNDISTGNIRISPNPFEHQFLIESPTPLASLLLTDARGKEIKRLNEIDDKKMYVSMRDYPPGIYFMELVTAGKIYSSKLIKN